MMTTMLEVAKRAGVSKATVSRVLSGNGYVSQETKDRVFQAVEESGYRPNLLARNLSAKSTQTLGLVVTNTLYHGIYFSELLFHAARMAEEKGRQLLLADGKHSAEEERQAIQYLLDLRCDAIMIYPRFLSVDEIDDIIDAHSQPIMVLNRRLRKNSSHSVWCDHKQTSFNAVAELITAGHQEIAFLTGSMDSPTSIERLAGYKDALAQHGIAFNEKLIPYIVPALSSVKIPVTEMIQEIIGRLIFMLDGGDFSPPKTFSGKLIRRGSLIALSR